LKKLLLLITVAITLVLTGCSKTGEPDITVTPKSTEQTPMSSQESLVALAYLSGGILDSSSNSDFQNLANGMSEFETEIEVVNVYMNQLKVFIENGTKGFASTSEPVSDNLEYEFMIVFTVSDEEYIIYYNQDIELTGILVIGDIEYAFEATDDLEIKTKADKQAELADKIAELELEIAALEELEPDEDNDQDDIDKEIDELLEDIQDLEDKIIELDTYTEVERKMELIATNLDNEIRIEYKIDIEDDKSVTKFKMYSTIDDVYKETEMKIVSEEDSYKVQVTENDLQLTFKRNIEDDGITYKLEYEINGERGQVIILEELDSEGVIQYRYKIQTTGKEKEIVKGKPKSKGRSDNSI